MAPKKRVAAAKIGDLPADPVPIIFGMRTKPTTWEKYQQNIAQQDAKELYKAIVAKAKKQREEEQKIRQQLLEDMANREQQIDDIDTDSFNSDEEAIAKEILNIEDSDEEDYIEEDFGEPSNDKFARFVRDPYYNKGEFQTYWIVDRNNGNQIYYPSYYQSSPNWILKDRKGTLYFEDIPNKEEILAELKIDENGMPLSTIKPYLLPEPPSFEEDEKKPKRAPKRAQILLPFMVGREYPYLSKADLEKVETGAYIPSCFKTKRGKKICRAKLVKVPKRLSKADAIKCGIRHPDGKLATKKELQRILTGICNNERGFLKAARPLPDDDE